MRWLFAARITMPHRRQKGTTFSTRQPCEMSRRRPFDLVVLSTGGRSIGAGGWARSCAFGITWSKTSCARVVSREDGPPRYRGETVSVHVRRRFSDARIRRSVTKHRSDWVSDIQPDCPGLHGQCLVGLVERAEGDKEMTILNRGVERCGTHTCAHYSGSSGVMKAGPGTLNAAQSHKARL